MCFDAEVLVNWVRRMREQGVELPVWIGLPGVLDRNKLISTSLRIGVGESVRFAKKQAAFTGKLLRSRHYRPDDLLFALAPHVENAELGIDGFYLFSFNQIRETANWRDEILAQLD